jgi:hypothetical protein
MVSLYGVFGSSRAFAKENLSPLLFVLVIDAISKMLSRAMVGGFVSSFRANSINTSSLEVSHLLFPDDTLIMCDANIYNLDHILLCFEAISGLKINFKKSKLVAVGEVPNIEELAGILNCRISSFPMKYWIFL